MLNRKLKKFLELMTGQIKPSGRLVAQKISRDGTEATRVADSQRRSSAADLNLDGSITNSIQGLSSQGEADNLLPCILLVKKLNLTGGHWETPVQRQGEEDGTDCVARNGLNELRMQVTRLGKQQLRRELSTFGKAEEKTTIDDLVRDLRVAIKKKEPLSIDQQRKITLVLDAMDFPSYTYSAVVSAFHQEYIVDIQRLNFDAIWVVGPTIDMTWQLDKLK